MSPGGEGPLGAAPDVQPAVLVPERRRIVRLDVALVDRLGVELALDDDVRLGEALLDVALDVLEVLGEVAQRVGLLPELRRLQVVVEQGSAVLHPLRGGQDGRQDLVPDVDQGQRLLRDVRARRRDSGDGVSAVERLLIGEDVVPQVLERAVPGGRGREVRRPVTTAWTPRERLGPAGVYRQDAGVGVRAA